MKEVQETRIVPIVSDEALKQIIQDAREMIEEHRNAETRRIIEF